LSNRNDRPLIPDDGQDPEPIERRSMHISGRALLVATGAALVAVPALGIASHHDQQAVGDTGDGLNWLNPSHALADSRTPPTSRPPTMTRRTGNSGPGGGQLMSPTPRNTQVPTPQTPKTPTQTRRPTETMTNGGGGGGAIMSPTPTTTRVRDRDENTPRTPQTATRVPTVTGTMVAQMSATPTTTMVPQMSATPTTTIVPGTGPRTPNTPRTPDRIQPPGGNVDRDATPRTAATPQTPVTPGMHDLLNGILHGGLTDDQASQIANLLDSGLTVEEIHQMDLDDLIRAARAGGVDIQDLFDLLLR